MTRRRVRCVLRRGLVWLNYRVRRFVMPAANRLAGISRLDVRVVGLPSPSRDTRPTGRSSRVGGVPGGPPSARYAHSPEAAMRLMLIAAALAGTIGRLIPRRNHCHAGHQWSTLTYPVTCLRCWQIQ